MASFRTQAPGSVRKQATSAVKWETPASTGKPLRPQDRAPLTANEMFREKKRSEANARDTGARAICKIKLALRQPDAQEDGKAATLEDWDEEFKPTLGSYKKFLLSRPDQFRIIEGSEVGMFTLEVVSNETVAAPNWEDIAWAKGWGKGKGKGKMAKDGSVPAPFPSAKGNGKTGKVADKGKGKGKEVSKGKGKGNEKGLDKPRLAPVTTLGLRVLTERAVSEVKQALLSPGCQADGRPYMPKDWSARYAPTLGPYMDFLLTQPDHFCLAESRPGNYTIEVVSADRTAKPERAARAVRQLAKAAQDELAAGRGPAADEEMEEVEAEGKADHEPEAGDDLGEAEEGEAAEEEGDVPADGYGEGEDADDDFAVDPEEAAEESDEDPAFPVEKAAKHGSYIRSLLSAGLLSSAGPAKRARTD